MALLVSQMPPGGWLKVWAIAPFTPGVDDSDTPVVPVYRGRQFSRHREVLNKRELHYTLPSAACGCGPHASETIKSYNVQPAVLNHDGFFCWSNITMVPDSMN